METRTGLNASAGHVIHEIFARKYYQGKSGKMSVIIIYII